jgi:hypothetical protein
MVANSGKLSTINSNPTAILTDKVDSPHSGLFTGIHSMAQGNYALKDHASTLGFAHTFTTSSGVIRVALTAGKGFSDGKYIAVDALSAHDLTQPATGAFYHWAVFTDDGDGTGTADIILGSTDGVVPELTAGSTPISLIKIQSTDTHGTAAFQTFTTSKTENALSIGYSNSNVYTEMSKISSAATGTTVEVGSAGGDFIIDNTDQDKKIVMRLGTDTSATAFEVRDNSDAVKFSVAGDGTFTGIPITSVASGANNRIPTFTSASALNGEDNLTFNGNQLGVTSGINNTALLVTGDSVTTDAVAEINGDALTTGRLLHLHSDASNTNTRRLLNIHNDHVSATGVIPLYVRNDSTGPIAHFEGKGNSDFLIIESTDDGASAAPDIVLYRNSADDPADGDDLAHLLIRGRNDNGSGTFADFRYADQFWEIVDTTTGTEDSQTAIRIRKGGNLEYRIRLTPDGNLINGDANYTGTVNNSLQVNHKGADNDDGILVVRDDNSTGDGDLLGGIGFDSADAAGSEPSSVTEASAFITSYATEIHSNADKGGNLKFGVSLIDEDKDIVSTILATVGPPDTLTASSGSNITTYAGIAGRATTVVLAASTTYTATTADTGIVIVLTTTTSKVVLPDIPNTSTIGTQFTVINAGGGTIADGITTGDASNCKVNGAVPSSGQVSIADDKVYTFIQFAADEWQRIG